MSSRSSFPYNTLIARGSHYARTMIFFSQAHILYISPLKPLGFGTLYPLKEVCLLCQWSEKSTASSASPLYRHRHRLLFLTLFLLRIISSSKGCLPLGMRIPGLLSSLRGYRHRLGKNHLRRHERQNITWVYQCIKTIKQRCTQKKDRKRFLIDPCGPITCT